MSDEQPPETPPGQPGKLVMLVPRAETQQTAQQTFVIGKLRELLGLAEQGRFADFAFVATETNAPSRYYTTWTPSGNSVALLGALDILHDEVKRNAVRRDPLR